MDENNNLQLQCWDIMLFARSNIDVVFPKRFSKYPFHNKWKLIWKHWKQNIYSIIRGVLGTIRKRLVKTPCKATLKLCLVTNNFGTFGNTIEAMGIHFFHCIHSGERIASHDVVWDAFAFIVKDVRFHVLQKQTHVFPSPFFSFLVDKLTLFCQLMAFLLIRINWISLISYILFHNWFKCEWGSRYLVCGI